MKQFVAMESATGEPWSVKAADTESAYKAIAVELGMPVDESFDSGDVDFDLYEVPRIPTGKAVKLETREE